MVKIFILWLSLLFLGLGTKAQKYPFNSKNFRTNISKHLKMLEKENYLPYNDSIFVYYLQENCTKNELIQLLKSNKPIFRIAAYIAIVNRKEADYFEILLNHLDDTAKVEAFIAIDVGGVYMVSDLMISEVKNAGMLNREQKDTLINKVLKDHYYLNTAKWMAAEVEPNLLYYNNIKNEALKPIQNCHEYYIYLGLARFQKEEDTTFIKNIIKNIPDNASCYKHTFRIIEAFPHASFFKSFGRIF